MHENTTFFEILFIFKKCLILFCLFPDLFLMVSVQEGPRNNKTIEFGLTTWYGWQKNNIGMGAWVSVCVHMISSSTVKSPLFPMQSAVNILFAH